MITRWLVLAAMVLGVVLIVVAFGQPNQADGGADLNRVFLALMALMLVGGGAWKAISSISVGRILTYTAIWIAIGVVGAGIYLMIYGSDAPVGTR